MHDRQYKIILKYEFFFLQIHKFRVEREMKNLKNYELYLLAIVYKLHLKKIFSFLWKKFNER